MYYIGFLKFLRNGSIWRLGGSSMLGFDYQLMFVSFKAPVSIVFEESKMMRFMPFNITIKQ